MNLIKKCFFISFFIFLPLYPDNDLTLVGFIQPDDGIGKISMNIIEVLKNRLSIHLIPTFLQKPFGSDVPLSSYEVFFNLDKTPGKVALLTDLLQVPWCDQIPHPLIPKECVIKWAYSMFETTKIPANWVNFLNQEFDGVVVPDPYLVDVYKNSGVKIPIFVLPIPMTLENFLNYPVHLKKKSGPFIFGDLSANKNPEVLIEAFKKAFGNRTDVQLFLRAVSIWPETQKMIKKLGEKYDLSNVIIESGALALDKFIDRLASFDCYVNLSPGEGFSFIPREALALERPTIISNNTASTTICNTGYVYPVVSYKRKRLRPHLKRFFVNEPCGKQFYCEIKDVETALLEVYNHYEIYLEKAKQGKEWVKQFDTRNENLQQLYQTLIKPKFVRVGKKNKIVGDTLITDSEKLLQKYQGLISK